MVDYDIVMVRVLGTWFEEKVPRIGNGPPFSCHRWVLLRLVQVGREDVRCLMASSSSTHSGGMKTVVVFLISRS